MKFVESLATAGGLGHIPKAPGTFGSLPGLALALSLNYVLNHVYKVDFDTFLFLSTAFGIFICFVAHLSIVNMEKTWRHDDSRIVIDEVAGQYFASVYFPLTSFYIVCSFILFRLFDIWKPWPISWIDSRWKSAFSTLFDDLIASMFALLSLKVLSLLL